MHVTNIQRSVCDLPLVDDGAFTRRPAETRHRLWPRCESASTHFELGANDDEHRAVIMRRQQPGQRTSET